MFSDLYKLSLMYSNITPDWIFLYPNQLSESFLNGLTPSETNVLMVESRVRQRMHPFHKKKLVLEISASRHFAKQLKDQGWQVKYIIGDEPETEVILRLIEADSAQVVRVIIPDDWHLRHDLSQLKSEFQSQVQTVQNIRHIADPEVYSTRITKGGFRMEYFYRDMRRKTGLLMDGESPAGGAWNFDKENRKPLPQTISIPKPPSIEPDAITMDVMAYVEEHFKDHFGNVHGFDMAVTVSDANMLADDFMENRLSDFGPYEDAMKFSDGVLFHSALSAYINLGLLDPLDLCRRAEHEYRTGRVPIASAEGFVRQIIGWREYVRVYYDAMLPEVLGMNALNHTHPLPEMYWSGHTQGMRCMEGCLKTVIENGFVHHIPRLMVLSNFANLTNTDPVALYEWFWFAFVDAHDWVVLPNVLGMSTYSDGGILASKPYIAGGNYIHKMSDFCGGCQYDPKKRTGDDACPFSFLYWNFVDQHRDLLSQNARLSFPVVTFNKMADHEKEEIRRISYEFISNLPRTAHEKL